VDKILGDGMLVLFGAPVAHEDDPERAVRAALRMQETVATFVRTSVLEGSDDVRMRVGINTGEVLVGTLAGTDYTAMGDVVNTASRLQSMAPPGGVVVGESTHGLTSHTFLYEPLGDLQPRGREQSLAAWLAGEPTAPPGAARRRRRDVHIVGRHAEMAIAEAAFDLVTRNRRGVVLHVNGENGWARPASSTRCSSTCAPRAGVLLEGACVPTASPTCGSHRHRLSPTSTSTPRCRPGRRARKASPAPGRCSPPWPTPTPRSSSTCSCT
jgi:hypothetical protein